MKKAWINEPDLQSCQPSSQSRGWLGVDNDDTSGSLKKRFDKIWLVSEYDPMIFSFKYQWQRLG